MKSKISVIASKKLDNLNATVAA